MSLEILSVGAMVTVQDRGREGCGHLGVSASGAADRVSALLANQLVGNHPEAALLEAVGGGLRLRSARAARLSITGASGQASVDGEPAPHSRAFDVAPGATLTLGAALRGTLYYVAVAGGIEVPEVLGSRSSDTLSGVGPAPLAPGDRLRVGSLRGAPVHADMWIDRSDEELVLRFVPGPRDDWYADPDATSWTVSGQTDRVGTRLSGLPLSARRHGELASEPTVRGAIQVPPSGQPIVFGPDHPVTGGYPVVGVLVEDDADALAQARPGTPVVLRRVRR
ncbi:MAG: biotin-dependent carboxyltransferase family protein [Arachnia sp.]